MKQLIVFVFSIVFCIDIAAGEKIQIVTNKSELMAAVSPGSPYSKVYVKGEITDLENVQLKENLIISGLDDQSKLIAKETFPKSDLLILSKNDQIDNITLIVPDYSGAYAIRNNANSAGSIEIKNVITNGEISINIADGSKDSIVTIINTQITLNNAPSTIDQIAAGIELLVQNNSVLTVQKLADNTIKTFGTWNMGIISHAYSNSLIEFKESLANNKVTTHGKQSHAIYNYAHQGIIRLTGGITHNFVTSAVQSNGIYNNTNENGSILIQGGISHNTVITEELLANAIANQAQTGGKINISSAIQDNVIHTSGTSSIGFYNCTGLCDTNGNESLSGIIDFTQAKIVNNKITTTYDNTSPIENIATTPGSSINFGFGSPDLVKSMLEQNNVLTHPLDATAVHNYIANGGSIS